MTLQLLACPLIVLHLTLPGFPFVKPETKLCVPCELQRKIFYAISLLVHTPRQFWSAYYSLQPNRQRIPTHLTNGHITAESAQNKCDLLNSFFVSTFTSNPPVFMQSTPVQNVPSLDSISCSSEDVHQLLTSLPSKTASGPDGISSQMLKMSASSIAPHLSALFNLSLSTGSVPTDWKLSHITPVYKAGDPSLVSNYRPISLLSLPSKVLERIVYNKLLHHLLSNSLLSTSQFGFRPFSSTQEAIISATTDWYKFLDLKTIVAAVFLTYPKLSTLFHIPVSLMLSLMSGSPVHSTSGFPITCPTDDNVWCWMVTHPPWPVSLLEFLRDPF